MIAMILDLLSNPYTIGAVAGVAATRWVIPPVWKALIDDIVAIWTKAFPAKS
jgi:hypothetical protein